MAWPFSPADKATSRPIGPIDGNGNPPTEIDPPGTPPEEPDGAAAASDQGSSTCSAIKTEIAVI